MIKEIFAWFLSLCFSLFLLWPWLYETYDWNRRVHMVHVQIYGGGIKYADYWLPANRVIRSLPFSDSEFWYLKCTNFLTSH